MAPRPKPQTAIPMPHGWPTSPHLIGAGLNTIAAYAIAWDWCSTYAPTTGEFPPVVITRHHDKDLTGHHPPDLECPWPHDGDAHAALQALTDNGAITQISPTELRITAWPTQH